MVLSLALMPKEHRKYDSERARKACVDSLQFHLTDSIVLPVRIGA